MVLNTWQISDVHPKSIEIPCVWIISPPVHPKSIEIPCVLKVLGESIKNQGISIHILSHLGSKSLDIGVQNHRET